MKAVRFVINWSLIVVAPIWSPFFIWYFASADMLKKDGALRKSGTGEEWLWSDMI